MRDGKLVELKDDDLKAPTSRAFYINKSSGLNWGIPKDRIDTRIMVDKKGNKVLKKGFGFKKNTYISKK